MIAESRSAVILCSGGIDSTTVMAIAKSEGYEIYSLSFRYGQRHEIEIMSAQKVSKKYNAKKHLILDINLDSIGGSALTDNINVPKDRKPEEMSKEIPITYVPARNTIFLSFALAWAEVLCVSNIFIGVNSVDYSGYPDCRPEYIKAFENMANLATKAGVEGKKIKIITPLMYMTKAEIIKKGIKLEIDYSITHSCYDPMPDGMACGSCDSCTLRKDGFAAAAIHDPAIYKS